MNILDINHITTTHWELFFLFPTIHSENLKYNPFLKNQASQSLPLISGSLLKENFLMQYV